MEGVAAPRHKPDSETQIVSSLPEESGNHPLTHPIPQPSWAPQAGWSYRSALTPTLLPWRRRLLEGFPKSLTSLSLLRTVNWAASQNLGGNIYIFKNSRPTKMLAVSPFRVKQTLFPDFPETRVCLNRPGLSAFVFSAFPLNLLETRVLSLMIDNYCWTFCISLFLLVQGDVWKISRLKVISSPPPKKTPK